MLIKIKSSIVILFMILMACTEKKEFDAKDLFNAVQDNNQEQIEAVLYAGVNPNVTDSLGNSVLVIAVENNDKNLVQYLLSKRVDPNIFNKEELSALDISRKKGMDSINILIQEFQYTDWLKEENKFTEEAFEFAVDNDNVKIVTAFIKNGRAIEDPCISKGLSPLIHAIFTDSYQVIFYLLETGANPNVTFDTRPAIAISALFNQYDVVKKLIEKNAEIDFADGPFLTALMLAAEEGNIEIVKLLLENGADKNLKDLNKKSAKDKAEKNGHTEVVNLLGSS